MELVIELIYILLLLIILIILLIYLNKMQINKLLLKKYEDKETALIIMSKFSSLREEMNKINELNFIEKIESKRSFFISDAISRSGSVTRGKVLEHFAPFLLDERFNPNEIVFMGSPIDLISFTNIDGSKELSIDFIEIKTGNSSLNKKQKLIKDAIKNRRVFYKKVFLQKM